MSDAEWDSWQSTWASGSGPLPDVRARAEQEARRHRRTNVTVFLLAGIAALGAVPAFGAGEDIVHVIGWAVLAFSVAMILGFMAIQRGIGRPRVDNPREALGFLERRLRAELQVAHLARWVYVGVCLVGGISTQVLYARSGSPASTRVMTLGWYLVLFALTFSAPWWVARTARRREAEFDRWRHWMDEQNL
jgi:hypothetical protein